MLHQDHSNTEINNNHNHVNNNYAINNNNTHQNHHTNTTIPTDLDIQTDLVFSNIKSDKKIYDVLRRSYQSDDDETLLNHEFKYNIPDSDSDHKKEGFKQTVPYDQNQVQNQVILNSEPRYAYNDENNNCNE